MLFWKVGRRDDRIPVPVSPRMGGSLVRIARGRTSCIGRFRKEESDIPGRFLLRARRAARRPAEPCRPEGRLGFRMLGRCQAKKKPPAPAMLLPCPRHMVRRGRRQRRKRTTIFLRRPSLRPDRLLFGGFIPAAPSCGLPRVPSPK